MKYMSDPFPARRDQHAFQIASRTFFTRRRQTRRGGGAGSRAVGHGLSLRRTPMNVFSFQVYFALISRNLTQKVLLRCTVDRV